MTDRTDTVVADTRRWLERAVIGLNLCPFAKSVHVKGQVHYAVSAATDGPALREDLLRELRDLAAIDPEVRDTTLLVAPDAFPDFLDFNDFLATADRALAELDLEGVIQIAPFHPRFVFAGTRDDDITNYNNADYTGGAYRSMLDADGPNQEEYSYNLDVEYVTWFTIRTVTNLVLAYPGFCTWWGVHYYGGSAPAAFSAG